MSIYNEIREEEINFRLRRESERNMKVVDVKKRVNEVLAYLTSKGLNVRLEDEHNPLAVLIEVDLVEYANCEQHRSHIKVMKDKIVYFKKSEPSGEFKNLIVNKKEVIESNVVLLNLIRIDIANLVRPL